MTLAALIGKRTSGAIATAIPATQQAQLSGTVATIATIAVADPTVQQVESWQEFERLLAIVSPAYRTPEHEYAEMRECALGDLANALTCYQSMAKQINRKSLAGEANND